MAVGGFNLIYSTAYNINWCNARYDIGVCDSDGIGDCGGDHFS